MASQEDTTPIPVQPILGAGPDRHAEADAQTAFEEMLNDEKTSMEATRAELDKLSEYCLTLVRAAAHAQTKRVFMRLGFIRINQSSNEYIRQYNAELTTLVMGKGMHQSDEPVRVKEETTTNGPSFEEQCAALRERMQASGESKLKVPVGAASHGHTPMTRPTANPTASSLSTSNVDTSVKEPVGTKQSTTRQTKAPSKELKNRIALQRIRLSQIRDGMNPTVSDQGIVFDEDNNPWLSPPGNNDHDRDHDPKTPREQRGPGDKPRRDSGNGRDQHGRDGGDPGDDGSDSSDDEGSQKGIRDPFTPCFQSRIPSLALTARSLEVKAQHTE